MGIYKYIYTHRVHVCVCVYFRIDTPGSHVGMYVFLYIRKRVHVCVSIFRVHVCVWVSFRVDTRSSYVGMYVFPYIRTHVGMYVFPYIRTEFMFVFIYLRTYTQGFHLCVSVYV